MYVPRVKAVKREGKRKNKEVITMAKTLKEASVLALIVALVSLSGTAAAQETQKKAEKAKPEVATLTLVCTAGGCNDDGPFCCRYDQKRAQKALGEVDGVTKVVMDAKTEQVSIDYEPGKLNLTELVQAAKKAGHELVLQ